MGAGEREGGGLSWRASRGGRGGDSLIPDQSVASGEGWGGVGMGRGGEEGCRWVKEE